MRVINSTNGTSNVERDSTGTRDENTGVGGSNPSPRTNSLPFREENKRINLQATMTPSWLAADMAALASISRNDNVLEPSAGAGAIVEALDRYAGDVTAVELNKALFKKLSFDYSYHVELFNTDFLKFKPDRLFDRVVMNPPHRNCVDHVRHAADQLRSGGRLVALLHAIYCDEIWKILPDVRFYHLPRETFVIDNNYIEAVIAVWDKI